MKNVSLVKITHFGIMSAVLCGMFTQNKSLNLVNFLIAGYEVISFGYKVWKKGDGCLFNDCVTRKRDDKTDAFLLVKSAILALDYCYVADKLVSCMKQVHFMKTLNNSHFRLALLLINMRFCVSKKDFKKGEVVSFAVGTILPLACFMGFEYARHISKISGFLASSNAAEIMGFLCLFAHTGFQIYDELKPNNDAIKTAAVKGFLFAASIELPSIVLRKTMGCITSFAPALLFFISSFIMQYGITKFVD